MAKKPAPQINCPPGHHKVVRGGKQTCVPDTPAPTPAPTTAPGGGQQLQPLAGTVVSADMTPAAPGGGDLTGTAGLAQAYWSTGAGPAVQYGPSAMAQEQVAQQMITQQTGAAT